mgnify:CR=1 FL=1
MKKYLLSICCCFLLWSCKEIKILSNDNCLKCSYQTVDEKITKEICDEDGNTIDKEESYPYPLFFNLNDEVDYVLYVTFPSEKEHILSGISSIS